MSNQHPNTTTHRRFVWLLWLLLLLPMAQTAATLHGYAHGLADDTNQVNDKQALFHGPCDICLIAAALIGGAPPAEPPALSQLAAPYEVPNANSSSVWISPFFSAYEGRAPPLALR